MLIFVLDVWTPHVLSKNKTSTYHLFSSLLVGNKGFKTLRVTSMMRFHEDPPKVWRSQSFHPAEWLPWRRWVKATAPTTRGPEQQKELNSFLIILKTYAILNSLDIQKLQNKTAMIWNHPLGNNHLKNQKKHSFKYNLWMFGRSRYTSSRWYITWPISNPISTPMVSESYRKWLED